MFPPPLIVFWREVRIAPHNAKFNGGMYRFACNGELRLDYDR